MVFTDEIWVVTVGRGAATLLYTCGMMTEVTLCSLIGGRTEELTLLCLEAKGFGVNLDLDNKNLTIFVRFQLGVDSSSLVLFARGSIRGLFVASRGV